MYDDHHIQLHPMDMDLRRGHSHSHERRSSINSHTHSHDGGGDHGHTHEVWPNAGSFVNREKPIELGRNWHDRAFTVGIGGYHLSLDSLISPVGSGI